MKKKTLQEKKEYWNNLRKIYEEETTKEEVTEEVEEEVIEEVELDYLTKEELFTKARSLGLNVGKNYGKETLIKKIMEVK